MVLFDHSEQIAELVIVTTVTDNRNSVSPCPSYRIGSLGHGSRKHLTVYRRARRRCPGPARDVHNGSLSSEFFGDPSAHATTGTGDNCHSALEAPGNDLEPVPISHWSLPMPGLVIVHAGNTQPLCSLHLRDTSPPIRRCSKLGSSARKIRPAVSTKFPVIRIPSVNCTNNTTNGVRDSIAGTTGGWTTIQDTTLARSETRSHVVASR